MALHFFRESRKPSLQRPDSPAPVVGLATVQGSIRWTSPFNRPSGKSRPRPSPAWCNRAECLLSLAQPSKTTLDAVMPEGPMRVVNLHQAMTHLSCLWPILIRVKPSPTLFSASRDDEADEHPQPAQRAARNHGSQGTGDMGVEPSAAGSKPVIRPSEISQPKAQPQRSPSEPWRSQLAATQSVKTG